MKQKVNDLNLPANQDKSTEETLRLQVALAHAGVASRRACEEIIKDGRVTVNGSTVREMGFKVLPSDVIAVDGKVVTKEDTKRYILLNKPLGYVCSSSDEKGRAVAKDLLKPFFTERLYNVGRLDMFSSGLILFTNDGDFAQTVAHPASELEKEYIVETSLPYPKELIACFMKGVRVDGVFYKCRFAERLSARKMRIVLIEGKNREIRRVIESFDVRVKSLARVRIGFLTLEDANGKALADGAFRELSNEEVAKLLDWCKNPRVVARTNYTSTNYASEKFTSANCTKANYPSAQNDNLQNDKRSTNKKFNACQNVQPNSAEKFLKKNKS